MKNEAYVFDTSALLAYIENEDGADIIENLILQVLNSEKDSIYISTVSMIET
jgi:PIN domain nuclease of toxin-antitoxin system